MAVSIKLRIPATKATLTPPIGPILGQYGIPGQKFCQEFNDETKFFLKDTILRVSLLQGKNKIILKRNVNILVTDILKRCIIQNSISIKRIYQLALIMTTISNSNNVPLKELCKSYIATVHSMNAIIKK